MLIQPEFVDASVVLVGTLNPAIFSPDWFARNDLLRPEQAESAEIGIIHPQITQFTADWLELRVDQHKLIVSTTQQPVQLHDLVLRTFREYLPHTPINKLGINRTVDFLAASFEARDQVGHRLAPPEAWGEWAPMLTSGSGDRHGGLTGLMMQQRDLDDRQRGHIQATVQASPKLTERPGLRVSINDHYELEDAEPSAGCGEILDLLQTNFDKSLKRSEWIIDQVMTLANEYAKT